MTGSLEYPAHIEDLYIASNADDVESSRPIMTGDIFAETLIPGLEGEGNAIVLTHPCSMRRDGVNLSDKLLMARVTEYEDVPLHKWEADHWKVMPLPGLQDQPHAARFMEIGLVRSDPLLGAPRIACLSTFGINLLQQRLVWYLTRFAIPTHLLNAVCEAVFVEADLCEEWVVACKLAGIEQPAGEEAFHNWIRAESGAVGTRQDALADAQHRATVRREMRDEMKTFGL